MSDAQQGLAPDCLQRALRSRFRQQVKPGVGEQGPKGKRTMTSEVTALLGPGDRAPNLVLPAVNQDGTISFEDYWLKGWLLLGLFRGVF